MTFAPKTLAIALATVSLGAAVVGTPASAHEHFGFSISFGGDNGYRAPRPVAVPSVQAYKVCPYGTHLGPYGHFCWANGNSYGY